MNMTSISGVSLSLKKKGDEESSNSLVIVLEVKQFKILALNKVQLLEILLSLKQSQLTV